MKKHYFLINGTDKKNIQKYSDFISTIVVNGNIAVHNKTSIIDYIDTYNLKIIIDPMTYILQSDPKVLLKINKDGEVVVKPSLGKVVKEIFCIDEKNINYNSRHSILDYLNDGGEDALKKLMHNVYDFQKKYYSSENDLGEFNSFGEKMELISSPYFDVHNRYYLEMNNQILKSKDFDLFRILISKETNIELLKELIDNLNQSSFSHVEIWVDKSMKKEFASLHKNYFSEISKKVFYKFVSFEEILEINNSKNKINTEGFITAFGYGESREIYPIGGGLPVNKVYSPFQRTRVYSTDFFEELKNEGIDLDDNKNIEKYKKYVCNCSICTELIDKNGLDMIYIYSEFKEYKVTLKNGMSSSRIAATQTSITLTNFHYIENKIREYDDFFEGNNFNDHRYEIFFRNKK